MPLGVSAQDVVCWNVLFQPEGLFFLILLYHLYDFFVLLCFLCFATHIVSVFVWVFVL